MKLGNLDVDSFKVGSSQVDKIYLGNEEIWSDVDKFALTIENTVVQFTDVWGFAVNQNPNYGELEPRDFEGGEIVEFGVWGTTDATRIRYSATTGVNDLWISFDELNDGEWYSLDSTDGFFFRLLVGDAPEVDAFIKANTNNTVLGKITQIDPT